VTILGYGDESEGRTFSLTACILEYDPWQKLTEAWHDVLKEPPAIEYFHMKEARQRESEFAGFSAIERDLKVIRLVSVIMAHRPRVLTTWVPTDDYREILGDPYAHETKHPYFPCFFALLIWTATQSRDSQVKLPVDFTFDEKGAVGINVLRWFEFVKKAASPSIVPYFGATPVFRDDRFVIPLQVADLIGWHVHRKLEVPGQDIERAATERLDDLRMADRPLSRDYLMEVAASFQEIFDEQPLAFIMQERPSRRRKLLAKLRKQLKRTLEGG
jgi:hypothetical protein